MTWRRDDPQGNEAGKVRFDVVPYMRGRVFDLGCGPNKVFPIAIGIDNRIDGQLFGIKITPDVPVDTCESMPMFADQAADTVFSSHLLEHVVDYKAALKEWWRLVKVNGYLVLYLPHKDLYPNIGTEGANPDHKHDFHPDDITKAMQDIAAETGFGWTQQENETRSQDNEYSFLQVFQKHAIPKTNRFQPRARPEKTLGVVRLGAFGDALWISGLLPEWKAQGYHVTVYTQPQGEAVLRNDPHIDRIICQPHGLFEFNDPPVGVWQHAYWQHEARKYDRFLNLIGSTERRLLPQPFEPDFYLPDEQRRRVMGKNYVQALHEWVGIDFDVNRLRRQQKFYPTANELAWAAEERAKIDGPLVLINPAGSSAPKWWPYAQELSDALAAERIYSAIIGDTRFAKFRTSKYGRAVGTSWPIRKSFALAALADVVVGTESALVNSVAFEAPLKIVLLSHSTHENLTRDWRNTIAVEPEGLPCYPCHRIHLDMTHCHADYSVNAALCQATAKPELIAEKIVAYLEDQAAKAASERGKAVA